MLTAKTVELLKSEQRREAEALAEAVKALRDQWNGRRLERTSDASR